MKKLLPVIIFFLAFTVAISGQVIFNYFSESSIANAKEETSNTLYEKLMIAGSYKTIDGKKIEVSKIKAPVIIYNFWASWCIPCLQEIPSMIELKKKFNDDQVVILAFNTDEQDQLKNIDKILKKLNIKNEFLIIADVNTQIAESFKFSSIPVSIIFSHGKVVHVSNGPMDFNSAEILEKIKKWSAR